MSTKTVAMASVGLGLLVVGYFVYRTVSSHQEALPVDLRPEFRVSDDEGGFQRYSDSDTQDQLNEAFDRVAMEVAGGDSDPQLSYLLGTRVDMMFAPDYEAWLAYVKSSLGSQSEEWAEGLGEDFRRMWEGSMKAYTNPMVDADGIRVERIDPYRKKPEGQPGTIWMRNASSLSAPYIKQEYAGNANDTKEAIEVFIPVVVHDAAGEKLGATISIVFGRDWDSDDWREIEMFVYMGESSFGREISMPPF